MIVRTMSTVTKKYLYIPQHVCYIFHKAKYCPPTQLLQIDQIIRFTKECTD